MIFPDDSYASIFLINFRILICDAGSGKEYFMRQTVKDLSLPVGDTQRDFRLHKLDAFSGVRVLKMLSASEADTIQSLLFALCIV